MASRKIVYLEHPVAPEVKIKHREAGERIVDIRFAPADYVAPSAESENVVKEKPKKRTKRKSKK